MSRCPSSPSSVAHSGAGVDHHRKGQRFSDIPWCNSDEVMFLCVLHLPRKSLVLMSIACGPLLASLMQTDGGYVSMPDIPRAARYHST